MDIPKYTNPVGDHLKGEGKQSIIHELECLLDQLRIPNTNQSCFI